MTLVTRDATSGRWIPQSAAEFSSLYSGTSIANPSSLHLCQEASGNLADSIGSRPFVGSGGTYRSAVTGWARKAVLLGQGTAEIFSLTGPNSGGSALMFAFIEFPSSFPASSRQ